MISSGGLSSLPSYKIWLQPWQITRCGIQIPSSYMDVEYLLVAKSFSANYYKAFNGKSIGMLKCGLVAGKIHFSYHRET